MPFTTWIRDLFGIRKDVVDTKKAKLEITKLEDEEDERRGLIDLASLDDVKKYDPKVRKLHELIREAKSPMIGNFLAVLAILVLLVLLSVLVVSWFRR